MFRYINAWLQAVLRYITAWLQAAADDPVLQAPTEDRDADASPQAAVDFPVTVSLGPLDRLLHSFKALKNNIPEGVIEAEIQRLKEDLVGLFTELKIVSKAEDPSFTAKCWMKEVRELCYDAEDYFTEVVRSGEGAGAGAGVRRNALLSFIFWVHSKLKGRSQIGEDFSDLWARVKDASQRRQNFQLDPETIRLEFGQASVSRAKSELSLQLLEEPMDKLVKLLGLDDEEIVELLAFDNEDAEEQVQVIPIFGFAGVGKTTLARTFYRNFGGKFQCRAFVRVSRNPDMKRLLSSMLSQIKAPPVHGFYDVQDLIDGIRKHLQGKRYLIIIDDLWASSTWDIISCAFPNGDCCSRIIITTEFKNVALACCRYQLKYMYEMSPLNDDQSRKLFLGRVFGSENGCPSDFKEATYGIIRKCGGLPLATVSIASILATEPNPKQWKHIQDSLPSTLILRTNPSSEGLKEVLNVIYSNLPPHLKTCLLYLIMYPEGYTIRKDELVKQWVAEDFIGEGQDREKTAGDYFDELVSRGMIQPVDRNYNDEVLTCTVHHIVLDVIRYKALEENFIINVTCFQTSPGLPDKVRRLSVQFGGAKCANIPANFMMTQVRSLIFFGFLNCVPSIVEYKLLRVLILHIWADQNKIFDLTGIGELFHLRYLKIDCNITVHLPDEIRQLKFLETLELHAPLDDMPSDISCLPFLRILSYFDLSKNSIKNVQSLGELNNLQDLHLTWSNTAEPDNLKNNMQCLGSILWKLSNLKTLTLVPAASSHVDVLDDAGGESVGISGDVLSSLSSPPALLQRLELLGRCCIFSSLPEWTKELGKLCILKIAVRKLLRKDIDILKGLPALTVLSLYVWTAPVGRIVFDNEGFSVLKYFKFICAAPCVGFLKGAMPTVRELKLGFNANRMEQYSQIGAGLEYLTELREITANVGGTGADESKRRYAVLALNGAIANHPSTPIIRVQCVDRIFDGEEDTSTVTQEQEHWTLEKQHEIEEELLDPFPELLISTASTQTQTRDGGQNGGTERSIEVLTQEQEQEHWTLEKQGIQEGLLDPLPELVIFTPSTQTQTRDGGQNGGTERSREVLTQEQEHCTLAKQHKIQEELLDPLPEILSTPSTQTQTRDAVQVEQIERSMEVVTQELERCTPEKQHEIQAELPLPELLSTPSTQTQARDELQDGEIERSMEVLTQDQDHWTPQKQHEIQEESLDPLPELLSTPSTQIQIRDGVKDGEIERSVEVVTHEQEHCTLEKQHNIEKELLDPLPELLSIPSTQTQTRNRMQNRIEGSMEVVSALYGTLGPLLGKLTALLADENSRLKGVRRKVHALRSELMGMYAALKKYTMLENADPQVKQWMSLMRELSYDVEDCIDKFMNHLSYDGRHGGIKGFFRMTARQLKTLGSRRGIAEQIDEMTARVKELKELRSYKLDDTVFSTFESDHTSVDPRLSALFTDEARLVGIDGPRDDLANWMVEEENSSAKHHRRVLSIVGFGGLGKTTLANVVYRKIQGHFSCWAFVSVSQKPDIKKIIKHVIYQVISQVTCQKTFIEDLDIWDEMKSIEKLRELLRDERYLVIIDDIWSIPAWDAIKCAFPENNCSSRIVITTRIVHVAMSSCQSGYDRVYELEALSDLHSKRLFFNRIFGSEDCCPDMLKEVSNEILKKCEGLPLAILSISGLLANRSAVKEEWQKVKMSIGSGLHKNISLEGMNIILSLSYNDLQPNLKTCLLYLSNFPENCVIERDRLVRRWIAEGFISEERGQSRREVAENYFYELINKSLVQAVDIGYDGKARACRVHNIMLEHIISRSAEENFITVVNSRQTDWENSHCYIRRLSIQHIDQDLASVLANKDLSHVRSLTVTASGCIKYLPSLFEFESLRVLDFEDCDGLEEYDMDGLDKLFHLKHLSLRGTGISKVPSGIVMLHDLETLDLRETCVEELPAGIVRLIKLQHLLASIDRSKHGIKIPNGIGNMRNLQVISGFNITESSVRAVEELGNLANLNELAVMLFDADEPDKYKRHEEMLLSSLCKLGCCKLQTFKLQRNLDSLQFLDSWSPLPYSLQRFEMTSCYYFRVTPKWISPALSSLAYLDINIVEITEEDLHILGEIPSLLSLRLMSNTAKKEILTVRGRGFRCLKEFVYDPTELPSGNLLFEKGALPRLEKLDLILSVSVVKANRFYIGIEHLPRLNNAVVRLYMEGASSSESKAAEVAVRNEANVHSNRPRVTLVEQEKGTGYR